MALNNSATNTEVQQHSLVQSIGLHLLPGVLTTVAYIILAPLLMAQGYPALLAILLAALFVAAPIELGYLLYQAKKTKGRLSLQGTVLYRESVPLWQYPVLILPLIIWAFVVSGLLSPLDNLLGQTLFAWLPDWFLIFSLDQFSQYPQSTLLVVLVLRVVIDGTVPIVEELYFRGFLLPRISRFGRWAPLTNVLLFSLYHFWTPWQIISRILFMLPMVYATWWKRNIHIAIITHCALNIIGGLLTIGLVLSQTGIS